MALAWNPDLGGRAGEGTGNAVLEAGKRWMAEQDFADPTEWNLS